MVPAHPSVLLKMATPRRYVDQRARAPDRRRRLRRRVPPRSRERSPTTLRHVRFSSRGGYYLQLAAAFGWTSLPWLFTLRQPTLIMAGADDPLVPVDNAHVMQWLIPDARLEIVDCGHLFLVTRPEESARIVESFLTEPALGARKHAAPRGAVRALFIQENRMNSLAIARTPSACDASLSIGQILAYGVAQAPAQEIVYADRAALHLHDARRARAPPRVGARRARRRARAPRSRSWTGTATATSNASSRCR